MTSKFDLLCEYLMANGKRFYYLYGEADGPSGSHFTVPAESVPGDLNLRTFRLIVEKAIVKLFKDKYKRKNAEVEARNHVNAEFADAFFQEESYLGPPVFTYADDHGLFVYACVSLEALNDFEEGMSGDTQF